MSSGRNFRPRACQIHADKRVCKTLVCHACLASAVKTMAAHTAVGNRPREGRLLGGSSAAPHGCAQTQPAEPGRPHAQPRRALSSTAAPESVHHMKIQLSLLQTSHSTAQSAQGNRHAAGRCWYEGPMTWTSIIGFVAPVMGIWQLSDHLHALPCMIVLNAPIA